MYKIIPQIFILSFVLYPSLNKQVGGYSEMSQDQIQTAIKDLAINPQNLEIVSGYQQVVNGLNYALVFKNPNVDESECFMMFNLIAYLSPKKISFFESSFANYGALKTALGEKPECEVELQNTLTLTLKAQADAELLKNQAKKPLNNSGVVVNISIPKKDEKSSYVNQIQTQTNNKMMEILSSQMNQSANQVFKFPEPIKLQKKKANQELSGAELSKFTPLFQNIDFEGNIERLIVTKTKDNYPVYVFIMNDNQTEFYLPLKLDFKNKELELLEDQVVRELVGSIGSSEMIDQSLAEQWLPQLQSQIEPVFFPAPVLNEWTPFIGIETMTLEEYTLAKQRNIVIPNNGFTKQTETYKDYLFAVHNESEFMDEFGCIMLMRVFKDSLRYPVFLQTSADESAAQQMNNRPPCLETRVNTFQTDYNNKLIDQKQKMLNQVHSNNQQVLGGNNILDQSGLEQISNILKGKYPDYQVVIGLFKVVAGLNYYVGILNEETNTICFKHFNFMFSNQTTKLKMLETNLDMDYHGIFSGMPLCSDDMFNLFESGRRILI